MSTIHNDRVYVIQGASSGIGEATAKWLAEQGAKVSIVARREERLAKIKKNIESKGDQAHIIVGDVTKEVDQHRFIEETLAIFGTIHGFFNNAGTIGNFVPLLAQSTDDLINTINTNFFSIWQAIKAQATYLKSNHGGAIVNTSSWLAHGGLVGSTTYSASKGAIDAMIRPAALEVSQYGIRINNVNPGGIDTEMTRIAFNHDESVLNAFGQSHPIGRMGSPLEVGKLVGFLLSDDASNITGQNILIDGGYTIPGQR